MRGIKHRLILDGKIVGYEKWYPGSWVFTDPDHPETSSIHWDAKPRWLYSRDNKYWGPIFIFHNKKDSFTTLHDKNGVEIYEGDVVRSGVPGELMWDDYAECISGVVGHIIYENHYFNIKLIQEGTCMINKKVQKFWFDCYDGMCSFEDIEVIGNIHQNPKMEGG
jgi:hypothetical protein